MCLSDVSCHLRSCVFFFFFFLFPSTLCLPLVFPQIFSCLCLSASVFYASTYVRTCVCVCVDSGNRTQTSNFTRTVHTCGILSYPPLLFRLSLHQLLLSSSGHTVVSSFCLSPFCAHHTPLLSPGLSSQVSTRFVYIPVSVSIPLSLSPSCDLLPCSTSASRFLVLFPPFSG